MRLLIAGGGSGGHVFPGLAIAEELLTRGKGNEVLYVGTRLGLEARLAPQHDLPFVAIPARGVRGKGFLARLSGLATIPLSLASAFACVQRYAPDVAIGVGGYAAFAPLAASWALRIPCAIHEQNALPGAANRVLGRFVDRIFLSFEDTSGVFPKNRTMVVGNPTRRALWDNFLRPGGSGVLSDRFTVLVLGGSQGAHGLNLKVLEALPSLRSRAGRLRFIHQSGARDKELVEKGYLENGITAKVHDFIVDMPAAYAAADLVVARAGATTIAELTVCRRASLLVPFPAATDDHQTVNAQALVRAGGAVMFQERDLTGPLLASELSLLMDNPSRIAAMSQVAGSLGRPEAAREIIDELHALSVHRWGPGGRPRSERRALPQGGIAP